MTLEEAIIVDEGRFVCRFLPDAEGGYQVRCAAFPGLISFGETLDEARRNAREALELCIEAYREQGWPLPPPDKEKVKAKLARA